MKLPALAAAVLGAWMQLASPAHAAPLSLGKDAFVLPGSYKPGRQPDGNSVVFAGPRGLVVVDSGRHVEHTLALLDFASARQQPILAVVNTHWHLDHLGGNGLLRDRLPDLQVLASPAVGPALQGWLATSRRDMQATLAGGQADAATQGMLRIDIALIELGARLLPDTVVSGPRSLDEAGRPLQIGVVRHAVTAADLWVHDPASRVLAAGDLVTLPVPFFDTACAAGWRAALAEVDSLTFDTLVPGHGAAMDRREFSIWRQAFGGLLDCAAGASPAAACADAWVAALGPLLPVAEQPRARGMLGYYLARHLRAPPAQRDRFCPASAGRPG